MELNAAVSAEIRAESAAQGISSTELARLSGVPYSTLARYLTTDDAKRRNIDIFVLAQVAAALGVTPAEIVTAASRRLEQSDASDAPQVETHADTTGSEVEWSRKPHEPSQVRARGARGRRGQSKA